MKDALGVFQSRYRELKPSVDIKEMSDDIANAQKVLEVRGNKSLKADDVDWIVIR